MMPINISLKNVPDETMEKLRQRAKRNHRSVQGELISIIENAVGEPGLTVVQAEKHLRELRFETKDESTRWVRELRDSR
jgi:plasmid stability protein